MKNQKGITLVKLIIIIAITIVGIIFFVEMSKPQDGIGSVKEETRNWEEKKNKLEDSEKRLKDAEDRYYNSLNR